MTSSYNLPNETKLQLSSNRNIGHDTLLKIAKFLTFTEFRCIKRDLEVDVINVISQILSPLQLSTITVGGKLSNICYNEETHRLLLEPWGKVLGVSCNFYEALLKKDGSVDSQLWFRDQLYPAFPEEPSLVGVLDPDNPPTSEELSILNEDERKRINLIREQYEWPCVIEKKKSNRGRKKTIKKKNKRKVQGSGKCFNSGIQAIVKGVDPALPDKYYKIKVYRNGSYTIPGVRREDLSDIVYPLDVLCKFFDRVMDTIKKTERDECLAKLEFIKLVPLEECTEGTYNLLIDLLLPWLMTPKAPVCVKTTHTMMQNYKCIIELDDIKLNIDELLDVIYAEKLEEYSLSKRHDIDIAEVTYTADRYAGITVKFWRDRPRDNIPFGTLQTKTESVQKRNKNKKTTIKLLQSGKINFDGAIEKKEITKLYKWLNELFIKNYNEIINDSIELPVESDSSDTDKSEYHYHYSDEYIDIYENEDSDHNDDECDYVCRDTREEIIEEINDDVDPEKN